jgi:hypothetical protein
MHRGAAGEKGWSMVYRLAIVALLVMACGEASAGIGVAGAGAVSCASFGKLYQNSPQETELAFFTWAQGYMSGVNLAGVALRRPSRDLDGMPAAHQQLFLRQYCNGHPLASFIEGVNELFEKLPSSTLVAPKETP